MYKVPWCVRVRQCVWKGILYTVVQFYWNLLLRTFFVAAAAAGAVIVVVVPRIQF